jgi:hypothetical protein
MARSDYIHKMVNGERVELTEAEIDECVARDEAWEKGAATRAAMSAILTLEAEITQRRQREAGADDAGGTQAGRDWMKAQEAKIITERDKL